MRSAGLFVAMAIVLTATASGCGGGGGRSDGGFGDGGGFGTAGVVSCTITEVIGGPGGTLKLCEEESGSVQTAQALQQSCTAQGLQDAGIEIHADFVNGPCSHVGALGGCRVPNGAAYVTAWYYDDGSGLQTSADIQTLCANAGATFVPP